MRRAFTLIEVLVVVAIIALLIAILIPALNNIKEEPAPGPIITYEQKEAIKIVESLVYVRDSSTGLVFAVYREDAMREGHGYLTVIPPTHVDRIEHLIVETQPETEEEEGDH